MSLTQDISVNNIKLVLGTGISDEGSVSSTTTVRESYSDIWSGSGNRVAGFRRLHFTRITLGLDDKAFS